MTANPVNFSTATTTAAQGFQGAATPSYTQYSFGQGAGTAPGTFSAGNGSPWTAGFVVELTAAAILDGTMIKIYSWQDWSVGWDTDYIWADQHYQNTHSAWLKALGITTAGTYTIIGTQDGTGGGLVLYVNGVSVGQPQNNTGFGGLGDQITISSKYNEHAIWGDIFVVERAITPSEAGTLHAYWAAKFIN